MITKVTTINTVWMTIRNIVVSMVVLFVGSSLVSCSDDKDLARKEYLVVSDTLIMRGVDALLAGIDVVKDTLYVYSNVEYEVFFRSSEPEPWFRIEKQGFSAEAQADMYIIYCDAQTATYKKRRGSLSFVSPQNDLGAFVKIVQGMKDVIHEDFGWLPYGSTNPFDNVGAKLLKDWNLAQKEKGWSSTPYGSASDGKLYGKMGYVMLGDQTNRADLVTPTTKAISDDSIMMLRFDALAYVAPDGTKDGNVLTATITGGGEFLGGEKTVRVELPYYDHTINYDAPGKTIWDPERKPFRFYIVDGENNPRTQLTKIQFVAGGDASQPGANRVFMDNIHVYALDEATYYLLDDLNK